MRDHAVQALTEILQKRKKPKEVLDAHSAGADKRDREFLTELVYGSLRHRDYLDWILSFFLRKTSGLSPYTLNNLRCAVYQAEFMRVPEWALVNEAVATEKRHKGKPSLVNGVLRTLLRERGRVTGPPEDDAEARIAVTASHPRWLVRRWISRFGPEEAAQLARSNNERPPLTIRLSSPAEREQVLSLLSGKGIEARRTGFSPVGLIIESISSYRELLDAVPLRCAVQDEAAQLVSYLLHPLPGERVLDACAAPGGKTTHIAQLMDDTGEVTAVEAEAQRIRQIEENVSRLGLRSVRIVLDDVRHLGGKAGFDRILLDAPCSALGVVRRNLDVKYRHDESDLLRFRAHQTAMLDAVSPFLKTGGDLVYSVCSTEPEEGEEVIQEFLQRNANFCIISGDFSFLEPFETVDKEGRLSYRTYPHRHGMDGFFFVRLRRSE